MEGGEDVEDPDYIAEHPPEPVGKPQDYFKVGIHKDQWSEYDDRGVPVKSIKKKKPTKKEHDQLEQEFLDAKKAYQAYTKACADWEQSKIDAETALKKKDRMRWAFRRLGKDKDAPIDIADMQELFEHLGWKQLSTKEFAIVSKGALEFVDRDGLLTLPSIREYVGEKMAVLLLEDRLKADSLDDVNPEDFYAPRPWREKLEIDPKNPTKRKAGRKPSNSPRASPRRATNRRQTMEKAAGAAVAKASPRTSARKRTSAKKQTVQGGMSPRG